MTKGTWLPWSGAISSRAKRLAAWTAVDKHVTKECQVIGVGSGSTVPYVVERILAQGPEVNKDRVFIPTGMFYDPVKRKEADRRIPPTTVGFQSKELIVDAHLQLGDVDQYPHIDVTIDGADEQVPLFVRCARTD